MNAQLTAVRTTARYGDHRRPAHRSLLGATALSPALRVVCLWAAFGLALTGLFCAMGFGVEIGQSLMQAG